MITFTAAMKGLMNRVFLDTSYAVALSAVSDEHHKRAVELADENGSS